MRAFELIFSERQMNKEERKIENLFPVWVEFTSYIGFHITIKLKNCYRSRYFPGRWKGLLSRMSFSIWKCREIGGRYLWMVPYQKYNNFLLSTVITHTNNIHCQYKIGNCHFPIKVQNVTTLCWSITVVVGFLF